MDYHNIPQAVPTYYLGYVLYEFRAKFFVLRRLVLILANLTGKQRAFEKAAAVRLYVRH